MSVQPATQREPAGNMPQDADVIVIGAGPAGMSASIELAEAGRRVIVLDMQPAPGGQIFRGLEANLAARPRSQALLAALGPAYAAGEDLIALFRATPGIDYRPNNTVWDLRADGTVGWLEGGRAGYLRAPHVILASGAMERPTPFPGWTLPGVLTAGAVQTLIKAGRLKPQGRIVICGTGPLLFLLGDQLRRLGVTPVMIARTDRLTDKLLALRHLRPSALPTLFKGLSWLLGLRRAGIKLVTGLSGLRAEGRERVEAVTLTLSGRSRRIPCDMLIVHDGIVPSVDLAHAAGLALDWQPADASWKPRTNSGGLALLSPGAQLTAGPSRIHVAGDASGIGGADVAIAHGRHVARSILAGQDNPGTPSAALLHARAPRAFIDRAFPLGLSSSLPADDTVICRCEEVTAGTLRKAIRAGATDINLLRALHRCGMGPCQGRNCAVSVARLIAETTGSAAPPMPYRARPPARPLPLGALAGLTGFDPDLARIVSLEDKPDAALEDEADA